MPKGKVKEYDASRGCGIIIDFSTGQQITVYANYINLKSGEIFQKGQDVEYEVENNRHQNSAINIRIL